VKTLQCFGTAAALKQGFSAGPRARAPDGDRRMVTHFCVSPTHLSQRPGVALGSGRGSLGLANLAENEHLCCAW
jgi:hypothetical protein